MTSPHRYLMDEHPQPPKPRIPLRADAPRDMDRFLPPLIHNHLAPSALRITKLHGDYPGGNVSYVFADGGGIVHLGTVLDLIEFVRPFYDRMSPDEIDAINAEMIERRRAHQGKPMPGYKPAPSSGYAYLLKCGAYYKIGIATDVQKRIKQLGTLPPFDLDLLHTISTGDMHALEKDLHERYADKRKNGEWFELDQDDVEYIKGL
jgi:hypothetical protein